MDRRGLIVTLVVLAILIGIVTILPLLLGRTTESTLQPRPGSDVVTKQPFLPEGESQHAGWDRCAQSNRGKADLVVCLAIWQSDHHPEWARLTAAWEPDPRQERDLQERERIGIVKGMVFALFRSTFSHFGNLEACSVEAVNVLARSPEEDDGRIDDMSSIQVYCPGGIYDVDLYNGDVRDITDEEREFFACVEEKLPPRPELVPEFRALSEAKDPHEWLRKIEELKEAYGNCEFWRQTLGKGGEANADSNSHRK